MGDAEILQSSSTTTDAMSESEDILTAEDKTDGTRHVGFSDDEQEAADSPPVSHKLWRRELKTNLERLDSSSSSGQQDKDKADKVKKHHGIITKTA